MEGGGGRQENAVETCVKRPVLQSSPVRWRGNAVHCAHVHPETWKGSVALRKAEGGGRKN